MRVEERLDRFYANKACLSQFAIWMVEHLSSVGSDHLPVLLKFWVRCGDKLSGLPWGKHFEEQWSSKPDCREVVDQKWSIDYFSSD